MKKININSNENNTSKKFANTIDLVYDKKENKKIEYVPNNSINEWQNIFLDNNLKENFSSDSENIEIEEEKLNNQSEKKLNNNIHKSNSEDNINNFLQIKINLTQIKIMKNS